MRAENRHEKFSPQPKPLVQRKCSSCEEEEKFIQTKIKVGATNDPLELEADRVASQVMRMPAPAALSPSIMSAAASAQRSSRSVGEKGGGNSLSTPSRATELTSGGTPLAPGLRQFFESRFGRDLSDVRVHTGAASNSWNEGLSSHAFTYGNHVWLGNGHTPAASFLFAHELAHVVQQTQPDILKSEAQPSAKSEISKTRSTDRSIQRLGLSDPFWIPLGAKGKLSGTDIHKELLGSAQKNNGNLKIEAPAPNANRDDWGLGLQGSIDLYLGDTMPGLFFDGRPRGEQHPDTLATEAKKHYRAALKGPNAASFKPFVQGGVIHGIKDGPKKPKLGELKPAVDSLLSKGDAQLANYANGLKMAADLTNEWAKLQGKKGKKKEKWNLGTPGRVPDNAVDFSDGGKDMTFNPLSPRDDTTLVLGTVAESSRRGAKYVHKIVFNPAKYGLPPIKGGLYAQKFSKGNNGLWMYFARPKNLDDALKLARSATIKRDMPLANQVQDQVINPVLKSPKKTTKKTPKKIQKKSRKDAGQATPLPPVPRQIQRAPKVKTPKLEDDFDYGKWLKNQQALRHKISGPGATDDTKKQIASMEFLHEAYKAEEALDKVPGTGKTSLPAKGTDLVNIVTGKGKTKKTHKKELSDLGGWLKGWTGKPAEALGYFRDKFGGAFTFVANKFIDIRDSIQKKFQQHFEKKSNVSRKSGKAKIVLQALGKALKQVAKILLPRTLHLVMDAITAGCKKKLKQVFEVDPAEMLDKKFGDPFRKWSAQLDNFKSQANKFVTDTYNKYIGDLKWLQDLIDLGKEIGPILEVAAAGIQCATPPVWGCLKLLARKLTDCAIAKAMNICDVQKEIADLTMTIQPLRDLPTLLGEKIMSVLKGGVPKELQDIFDEPLAKPPKFDSSDIECEFTELPSGCPNWGLIELDGGKGAPGKDSDGEEDDEDGESPEQSPGPDERKGKPPPAPRQKAQPAPRPPPKSKGGATESEQQIKKREEFLEKLTKEELDELYREAKRQGLMEKPFTVEKAEELLKKARENLRKKKERARKRRQERARKAKEKAAKDKEKSKEQGGGKQGSGAGACTWSSKNLSVGGFLLDAGREDMGLGNKILDHGHTGSSPFREKLIFACGGISLRFKYDFIVGDGCPRDGAFTKPVVSADIRFKPTSGKEIVLFNKTESKPWANDHFADPNWGAGSRIELGHFNTNGEFKIKLSMLDPDTGVTRSISATIPVDVNCT